MELTPRQIFDKYRSMYAMLKVNGEYYVRVQVCGFAENRLIIAFKEMEGPIKEIHKGVLFDEGYFDGQKAMSYSIVEASRLMFIDNHATERLKY